MDSCFKWRAIFIPVSILILCLMPALLLYFLGYVENTEWNNDAVETKCTVIGHKVKDDTCYYTCNCVHSTNTHTCATCEYECYHGYVDTNYTVDHINYNKTFGVYDSYEEKDDVVKKLNKNYPIGKKIDCYYQKDDPTDIKRGHVDTNVFLAFFIIFCIVGFIILVVWISLELYCKFKN